MPLSVLICGGGCAGPALAFWLSRLGHDVTIVERYPALRAAGAQIDLRAQGIQVAERMGLLSTIREHLVDEAGVSFVNSDGEARGTIMANKSGKGQQTFTSEYEVMRGDLVRVFYEATKDKVQYVFGKTVEGFKEDEGGVMVEFSDGSSGRYDMLVGADGQGSRIRKAILPENEDPYIRLGVHAAYWFIPRTDDDSNIRRTYHAPGGRMIMRRTHNATETQVYFMLRDSNPALSSVPRSSEMQQKEFWTQRFRDAGWQTPRFLAGMQATDNFYCQEVVQVRTRTWHKGRVVLLGDAAHCASPFSGMGTTGSLVGAYVLAGEMARHPGDLKAAFEGYDRVLRPFTEEMQEGKPALIRFGMPMTAWGIRILHFITMILCFFRIPEIMAKLSPAEHGEWKLPEYPELPEKKSK